MHFWFYDFPYYTMLIIIMIIIIMLLFVMILIFTWVTTNIWILQFPQNAVTVTSSSSSSSSSFCFLLFFTSSQKITFFICTVKHRHRRSFLACVMCPLKNIFFFPSPFWVFEDTCSHPDGTAGPAFSVSEAKRRTQTQRMSLLMMRKVFLRIT